MWSNSSLMPPRWLIVALAVVLAAMIAYVAWWRQAAAIMTQSLNDFRTQSVEQGATAHWDTMAVNGFPLRLRAQMVNPTYANQRDGITWRGEALQLEMLPWSLSRFVLSAKGEQKLTFVAARGVMDVNGRATTSQASVDFLSDGVPKQFDAGATGADFKIDVPMSQAAKALGLKADVLALHWRIAPDDKDPKNGQDFNAALNATALELKGVTLPLGERIDDLKFMATLKDVPAFKGVAGAMDLPAWMAGGANLTVDKLAFVSGGVDIAGAGQLGLAADGSLQGELALTIGGVDKLIEVLSREGVLSSEAKTALFVTGTVLAATGAKVPLALSFRDGQTFLGPARLGPAPRLVF